MGFMTETENRADAFLSMIRRSRRGRLKIYLGYVAGVGKTYEMLLEGHRLKELGIDIAIGLVETHGRAETAKLVEGLEVIPRRKQEYRGILVEEMDVDAVLARRPQIALIDELAHTNVPGSRNSKRYEDVQEILDAGIHVISTLNIQHLESLYNIVEQATGIKVRERIPDIIVAEADQLVNVDLTYEDLQERLSAGKIYPKDRIETALRNFFKKTNLDQLRELTLRETAALIDLRYRTPVQEELAVLPDQVMVCLSSRGPNSERLLRYGSRLAGKLNRNWYAVYVQTPGEEATEIDAGSQRFLADTLTLAKQLGAIVFTFKGEDIVQTILQFAKEYRVGHIIIGSPAKISLWKRMLGKRSFAEELISKAKDITIVVQDTSRTEETFEINVPEREGKPREQKPAEVPTLSLSGLVSKENIILWDRPISKDEALRQLVTLIWEKVRILDPAVILEAVLNREKQGSTFFNEGIALPHARIEGLDRSFIAIGITRKGLTDVSTERPIECIVLILTPAPRVNEMIELLAKVSKFFGNSRLVKDCRGAKGPADIVSAIRKREAEERS
jgi:two-component system sensor histidine kinase KdpD